MRFTDEEETVENFNSIKVRLEPQKDVNELHNILFQFHKGAIRTYL